MPRTVLGGTARPARPDLPGCPVCNLPPMLVDTVANGGAYTLLCCSFTGHRRHELRVTAGTQAEADALWRDVAAKNAARDNPPPPPATT